ncbi:MAG: NHL repeat-containing protein [Chloroflexi bacterium]|nr:NHL repeat-containing protein [Chloroflexota bacterium]
MVTQLVAGRVFDFSRVIGRGAVSGAGFNTPIDMCLVGEDKVFVVNRGAEYVPGAPWNKMAHGSRIGVFTIGGENEDEEWVSEFGDYGDGVGEFIWPAGVALDSRGNAYITDEWMNRVTVYGADGKYVTHWGSEGSGPGQFLGPNRILIDDQDTVYVVDGRNNRVQKLGLDGSFKSEFGVFGGGEGQFNNPWGLTIGPYGYVYIADTKNNRVQKLTTEGVYEGEFGSYGTGRGQLNRPSDVTVDADGDVYVCDWGNSRVQVFGPDGRFLTSFVGDAQEFSKWARPAVNASPQALLRRREVKDLSVEWRLAMPQAVEYDHARNRLLIADTQRNRIQIYSKLDSYSSAQKNL